MWSSVHLLNVLNFLDILPQKFIVAKCAIHNMLGVDNRSVPPVVQISIRALCPHRLSGLSNSTVQNSTASADFNGQAISVRLSCQESLRSA